MELFEEYKKEADLFMRRYGVPPSEHICNIIISVMLTRDGVLQGGDFVQAICRNDLAVAVRMADKECLSNIKFIVLSYDNAFISKTSNHST